ncbi:TlpA disulfide reductase family protein [Nocardioides sp.]|uniref:TlpA disulfide reductase family protein n=1 Tax=Nocardioides sp. TaxID=35761 RepID=UPI0039E6B502
MKRLIVLVALLLTACDGAGITPPHDSDIDVATPELVAIKAKTGIVDCPTGQTTDGGLPRKKLQCLGGGTETDLSTLKGPLILNFWSSACAYCIDEMPALEEFWEKYGDRVPILGVDTNDTYPGVALKQAHERGVTYPLVADPGGDLQQTDLRIIGQPTFFFLSADGKLSDGVPGGLKSLDEVVAMVDEHLGLDL